MAGLSGQVQTLWPACRLGSSLPAACRLLLQQQADAMDLAPVGSCPSPRRLTTLPIPADIGQFHTWLVSKRPDGQPIYLLTLLPG